MPFSAAVFLHREMDNAKTNKKRTVVLGNCSVSTVSLQCEIEVSMAMQTELQPMGCLSIRYEVGAFFIEMPLSSGDGRKSTMIFDVLVTHFGTDRPLLRSDVLPFVVTAYFVAQTFRCAPLVYAPRLFLFRPT